MNNGEFRTSAPSLFGQRSDNAGKIVGSETSNSQTHQLGIGAYQNLMVNLNMSLEDAIKQVETISAKAQPTDDEINEWVAASCVMISNDYPIGKIKRFITKPVSGGNKGAQYSRESLIYSRAKKVVDLFFIRHYFKDYLAASSEYVRLVMSGGELTQSFNFEQADDIAGKTIKRIVSDLSLPEPFQLFFFMSLKSPECVRESQEIRKKLDTLRGKALRWMRESRRNQSNDGRSLFEQVDELIEYCHALLSAEGKVQAAADLINVNGRDIHRATLMNVKRRVEKILKLDTPEKVDQFWKYVELQSD
jgi:hypothetical protein